MKKINLLACLLILGMQEIFAQNTPNLIESTRLTISKSEVVYNSGSAYLLQNWELGKVIFGNGSIQNAIINYNALNERLEYKDNSRFLTFPQPVNSFILGDTSLVKGYYFQSGFQKIDKQSEYSFYQVLYQSPHLKILKHIRVATKEEKQFNDATTKYNFIPIKNYYVANENNELFQLRKTEKSILSIFPSKSNELKTYVKENKIKLKKWEDVIDLIAHADKI